MRTPLACCLPFFLTACDPLERQCGAAAALEPAMTIGTGSETFEPIEGPVQLAFGIQGGNHMWLSLELIGIAPGVNRATFPTMDARLWQNGIEVGSAVGLFDPLKGDTSYATAAGMELRTYEQYWWDEELAAEVGFDPAAAFQVTVSLEDVCGTTVSAETEVFFQ